MASEEGQGHRCRPVGLGRRSDRAAGTGEGLIPRFEGDLVAVLDHLVDALGALGPTLDRADCFHSDGTSVAPVRDYLPVTLDGAISRHRRYLDALRADAPSADGAQAGPALAPVLCGEDGRHALILVHEVYQRRPDAADRPIKGYIEVTKLVVYIAAAVLVVAALMDRSPMLLLSGLGAMAAVLMLVFKDTILSLVASVQLRSNDMVRVGDWIEMPQLNANGDVIDIALHTVKVQNFDLTITTIPTYRCPWAGRLGGRNRHCRGV